MSGARASRISGIPPARLIFRGVNASAWKSAGRGRHDEGVRGRQLGEDGLEHLRRPLDPHETHVRRRVDRDGTRDEDDLGATLLGLARERVAHPSRAAVREEPHRVDRLARRAGGHDDPAPGQAPRDPRGTEDGLDDPDRSRHPSRTDIAAGEVSRLRVDDDGATPAEDSEVLLSRRMGQHPGVHRGRDDDRLPVGEGVRRESLVADPTGHLREDVGRRGGHGENLAPARQLDVVHGTGRRIPQVGDDR